MSKLAIKGHSTRGNEVIEILEMLGGRNSNHCTGRFINRIYFINKYGYIESTDDIKLQLYYATHNLEEFLEKFPYKVGDKVKAWINGYYSICNIIQNMRWDGIANEIKYKIQDYWYSAMTLQPYKEENMEQRQYKELRMPLDDDDKLATEVTIDGNKILPPNGYLIGKITQVDNGMLVEYVKQQPSYPKTHEECFNICFGNKHHIVQVVGLDDLGDNKELFESFIKLKICRDAYWKIAGDKMRLGKPWEPDWNDENEFKYGLYHFRNGIMRDGSCINSTLLAFPTEEMRDTFYNNFKELINEVKELL